MIFLAFLILAIYTFMCSIKCDTAILRVWSFLWGVSAVGGSVIEPSTMWDLTLSLVFILCLTLALAVGNLLVGGGAQKKSINEKKLFWELKLPERMHRRILYACLMPAYLSVGLLVNELELGIDTISSLENLVTSAAKVSYMRYHDDYNPEALTRFLLVFVYLSGGIAGWYSCRGNAKKTALNIVAAAIPVLLWTIILTTKAALIFWIAFFIGARMSFGGGMKSEKLKIFKHFLVVSIIIIFFYLVQLSRYGGDFEKEGIHTFNVLAVSATGHIIAFGKWFDAYAALSPSNFGHNTFAGVFELIGASVRGQGLGYEDVPVGESATNVYSALRNIVQDFGVLVSVFLFISMSLVTTALNKHSSLTSCAVHFMILVWVMLSPLTSIYNYNTLLFASLILVIFSMVLDFTLKLGFRRFPE